MMNYRFLVCACLLVCAAQSLNISWHVGLWPVKGGAGSSSALSSSIAPIQVGDILLVNPLSYGPLFAVNMSSKSLLWGQALDGITFITPVPEANVVVVTVTDFTFGYDLNTGKQLWFSDVLQAVTQPFVIGGMIVLANADPEQSNSGIPSGIVAVDARTGTTVYSAFNSQYFDTLYPAGNAKGGFINNGVFTAFDLLSGNQLWEATSNATFYPALEFVTSSNDYVVLANTTASGMRELAILDANTGKVLRRVANASGAATNSQSAQILSGVLYVTLSGPPSALTAINLQSGATLWSFPITALYGAPTVQITDSYVIASNFSTYEAPVSVTIARFSDGAVLSTTMVPTNADGTMLVTAGKVFIPNLQGLIEISLATGRVVVHNENLPEIGSLLLSLIDGEFVFATESALMAVNPNTL